MSATSFILKKSCPILLCADARFGPVDPMRDILWRIQHGVGEPDGLRLQSDLNLRVRELTLLPRFFSAGEWITSPEQYEMPVRVDRNYPNSFVASLSPFQGINVQYEVMVPSVRTLNGRISLENTADHPIEITFELVAILLDWNGKQCLRSQWMQSQAVLKGTAGESSVLVRMTGGIRPEMSAYPCLSREIDLQPGEKQALNWAAAWGEGDDELIQPVEELLSIPWDLRVARIELIHQRDDLLLKTNEDSLKDFFKESQKAACQQIGGHPGCFTLREHFPFSRLAPPGSRCLEAAILADQILPQMPAVAMDLLQGALPGDPPDPAERDLSVPVWAEIAWKIYEIQDDPAWLKGIYPRLLSAFWRWFSPENDRDRDSFPEYTHPLQTWYPENPLYCFWMQKSVGCDLSVLELPVLGAILLHECRQLQRIAEVCGDPGQTRLLKLLEERIKAEVEACWDERSGTYLPRDRDFHHCSKGKRIGKYRLDEEIPLPIHFDSPTRLFLLLSRRKLSAQQVRIQITGEISGEAVQETIESTPFDWENRQGRFTTQVVLDRLDKIQMDGLDSSDTLTLRLLGCRMEDLTCYLPLWAGIPDADRAARMVKKLLSPTGYLEKYGLSNLTVADRKRYPNAKGAEGILPLNQLLCQGLRDYGYHAEAVEIAARNREAMLGSFQRDGCFRKSYNVVNGIGCGEVNHAFGLPSPAAYLEEAGIRIFNPEKVLLSGQNGLGSTFECTFRGMKIDRRTTDLRVQFTNGQVADVEDHPNPQVITLIRQTTAEVPERSSMTAQETSPSINYLLIAVVQAQDADNAVSELNKLDVVVTRLPSVGGFLGRRNVTLLIGMPVSIEATVINSLRETCRQRVEYITIPLESAPLPLPAPTPITIGGATIFSLELDHYEVI